MTSPLKPLLAARVMGRRGERRGETRQDVWDVRKRLCKHLLDFNCWFGAQTSWDVAQSEGLWAALRSNCHWRAALCDNDSYSNSLAFAQKLFLPLGHRWSAWASSGRPRAVDTETRKWLTRHCLSIVLAPALVEHSSLMTSSRSFLRRWRFSKVANWIVTGALIETSLWSFTVSLAKQAQRLMLRDGVSFN
jgi:hypothetical protein